MKLGNVYRDINSFLTTQLVDKERIYHNDVIKVINDAISSLRLEYIKNGLGNKFVKTVTLYYTIKEPTQHPFLYFTELDEKVLSDLPLTYVIKNSIFWKSQYQLEDSQQTFSKGDYAIKGNYLYECLEDISSQNTYDLTFIPEKIRNISVDNNLKYLEDDIVTDGTDYWRVTNTFVNDTNTDPSNISDLEKLYWKRVSFAFRKGTIMDYSDLYLSNIVDSMYDFYPFTIFEDIFYTPVPDVPVTISYIPEWTYVTNLDTELNLPDSLIPSVKTRAIQLMANKIGISQENIPEMQESNIPNKYRQSEDEE